MSSDTIAGRAAFETPHYLSVEINENETRVIEAEKILIATGSRPVRPPNVPFDAPNVLDSDHITKFTTIPRTLVVIGVEYASILSALDIDVTMVDGRREILGFLDREIVDEFSHHLRDRGVSMRLGETVESVDVIDDTKLIVHLASGKRVRANTALFTSGRHSNTDKLQLDKAGLTADERGRLKVDEHGRTEIEHIYAAGDVIGFPALASTSMEQGRLAAAHAFGGPLQQHNNDIFPFGIYAVPEMSVVGKTEEELRDEGIPYESGTARFRETSRGQILGLREGLLKILVHLEDRRVLGVHIVGEGATELIHIGQAVIAHDGTLDFFVDAVFNYPTLAETYKIAALDAWNKL